MRRLAIASLAVPLALLLAAAPVAASSPKSLVLPPTPGLTGYLGTALWNWAVSIPPDENPLAVSNCNADQTGLVFYVFNTYFGNTLSEDCSVTAGRWLFVSPGGTECSIAEGNGPTVADLKTCVATQKAELSGVATWIDGRPIPNIDRYYAESGPFVWHVPDGNLFGVPAGDTISVSGVWGMLVLLPVGVHTIVNEDTLAGAGVAEVIATVTVSPRH
ncbi:MAG TPA: hypothetical protein VEI48_08140 [Candidatus Sulfotelmatobacter sp.]|nr:hypothetical protein [Candidatus Sulfotelmatobacter sp.]